MALTFQNTVLDHLSLTARFPNELAAALATHHDDPVPGEKSVDNTLKISWRLADSLGYSAYTPDEKWTTETLLALIPNAASSWLGESLEFLPPGPTHQAKETAPLPDITSTRRHSHPHPETSSGTVQPLQFPRRRPPRPLTPP